MNCRLCNKKIVLVPSAKERAKKYGGKASDYTNLFTAHSSCVVNDREKQTSALIKRVKA